MAILVTPTKPMEWISQIIAESKTVFVLVSSLFLLAIVFTLKFRSVVRRAMRPLSKGVVFIEGIPSAQEFFDNYSNIRESISEQFQSCRALSQQWQRFQMQIVKGSEAPISAYRLPEEFFNSRSLLKDRWLPLCKAGPSYLVGIGLVFTFLGIAVVIYRASLALGTTNDLKSLRDLLGAASLKFWTSMTGVGLSVICSGYFRHLTARFDVIASEFSHAIANKIGFLSQEYSLHLSTMLLTSQSAAVNELRNEVIQHGKENTELLVTELQALKQGLTSVTEDTFSNLVEKSTAELSAAITNSLSGVAETFVSINTDLKTLAEQITPLPTTFRETSENISRSTTELLSQLKVAGQGLNEDFQKAKTSSEEISSNFLSGAESAGRVHDSLSGLPDTVSRVASALDKIATLEDVSQKLHAAAAAVRTSSDSLLANWQGQSEHVKTLDEKLAQTVASLPSIFAQYSDALQKFSEDFDNHLGRVLGSLATQVESLETSQDSLRSIVDSLHSAVKNGNGAQTAEQL